MRARREMAVSHERLTEKMTHGDFELVLSLPRPRDLKSRRPSGLVATSDDEVRQILVESLGECGLGSMFSSTVAESRIAMSAREVFVVVSDEWLPDGTYMDIANWTPRLCTGIPLVVVSRTGDWPEYLRAVAAGAFDYVAYPPIRGELQRVIRNALRSRHNGAKVPTPLEIRPGGQKA